MRFSSRLRALAACLAIAIAAGGPPLRAQSAAVPPAAAPAAATSRFTLEDALDLTTYRVADLSDDGAWLVALSSARRDGLGVDYHRDGDPTYLRPQPSRLWIVDTKSGATRALFPDKRDVGGARWSPDASRLAMLVRRGDAWQPMVWERARGRFTTIPVPAGRYVAENSDVRWSGDGRSVLFAVHTLAWRDSARARFVRQTTGPVFVQSSTDPFLAWDALRRAGNVRAVAAYDVAAGRTREVLPEAMIASYQVSLDGSTITWSEDITKKTDYDVIGGSENRLLARAVQRGADSSAVRVLLPTLKGVTLVWAEDGMRYAYAKDGRLRIASVADTASRLLAGLAPTDTGPLPTDSAAADSTRKARERQRFVPVRFSRAGDALVASNQDGLWLIDVASGRRELFVETPDSTLRAPTRGVIGWSADGRWIYLSHASRQQWQRGVLRYDRTRRALDTLVLDTRSYNNFQLSRDGSTAILAVSDVARPADLYAADADLKSLRRLVRSNPQLDGKALGSAQLLDYLDADGHRKYGVVYLPPGLPARHALPDGVQRVRGVLQRRVRPGDQRPHEQAATSSCSRRSTSTSAIRARRGSRASRPRRTS